MDEESFQRKYVDALTSVSGFFFSSFLVRACCVVLTAAGQHNPLLRSSMLCGQLHQELHQCQMRHGRDSEECAEQLVNTLACMASVFAPREFDGWKKCVETGDGSEACGEEMQAALAASERNYNGYMQDVQYTQDAATVAGIRACGFPGDGSEDESRMNQVLECVAPLMCPGQLQTYMDCVEKHGGNYGDPACLKSGDNFARCFGSGMAEAALREEMENM